jgi:hypothetical protein
MTILRMGTLRLAHFRSEDDVSSMKAIFEFRSVDKQQSPVAAAPRLGLAMTA